MRCVRWSLIVLLMLGIGAGCERGGEGEPECAPMEFAILDVSGCAFHEDGEFVFRSREPWDAFVEEYCGGEDPEDGSTDFEGDMIAGVVVLGS